MKVLGIDIGGSGIKGAIVETETGELLTHRSRFGTPQPATPKAVSRKMMKMVQFEWSGPVGCGFPALIQNGVVRTAANISSKWIGIQADEYFAEKTGCETVVLNDADAAGQAEVRFGAGRDRHGVILVITVGTGLGTALFVDGMLVPNTEFGHLFLRKMSVIAERYTSDAVRKDQDLSWRKWAQRFNLYLNHIDRLLSPDTIVLGGGVSRKFDKFSKYLEVQPEVIPAQLLNNAGIIGAALSAERNGTLAGRQDTRLD